jgi:hypothetical protein
VRTGRVTTDQGTWRGYRTSEGTGGFVARGDNNLYAGRDGNVYRRNEGGWQKYEGGDWSSVQPPGDRSRVQDRAGDGATVGSAGRASGTRQKGTGSYQLDRGTYGQLDRDYQGRTRGSSRARSYDSWNRGGGAYRGRAGMRGGGRRRESRPDPTLTEQQNLQVRHVGTGAAGQQQIL